MTKIICFEAKEDRLIFSDGIVKDVFEIKARKEKFDPKKDSLYFRDRYWQDGGPCPPGEYYLFYRYRRENGKIRARVEFCQTKPKKPIINEEEKDNLIFLKKQGLLKFKNSADRANIQIHGGSRSQGCLVISKEKKFYKLVLDFLKQEYLVKIKLDDYWKTKQGKKEKDKYSAIGWPNC